MKTCRKCNTEKPLHDFVLNKSCKGGRAGTCKSCSNGYGRKWKEKNKDANSEKRRDLYYEKNKEKIKERQRERELNAPLKSRAAMLRSGMVSRSRLKGLDFDSQFFSNKNLIERLKNNPNCECCGKVLDVGFKHDRKFNDDSPSMDRVDSSKGYTAENTAILCWRCNKSKQDSTAEQLRAIADFMDKWSN
ncbi:hypothetical protein NVP1151O_40 [Vibrio phage 1.151.O._10N.222.46.B1]|nr:hypothetical protein NVP1151O_40 [Vibrio phage 1.151.O._10N.222.46.B1]